jgi:S-(hydroxymethyl)glutathione dehydrogenase/alcohol dehydrogenase
VPQIADKLVVATCAADHFITHTMDGIEKTNEAIEALHGGDCLRAVVKYSDY